MKQWPPPPQPRSAPAPLAQRNGRGQTTSTYLQDIKVIIPAFKCPTVAHRPRGMERAWAVLYCPRGLSVDWKLHTQHCNKLLVANCCYHLASEFGKAQRCEPESNARLLDRPQYVKYVRLATILTYYHHFRFIHIQQYIHTCSLFQVPFSISYPIWLRKVRLGLLLLTPPFTPPT